MKKAYGNRAFIMCMMMCGSGGPAPMQFGV